MKKLLLILLLTTPFIGFGQGCQYGSSTDVSDAKEKAGLPYSIIKKVVI